jgi:hypothetical protein
MADVAEMTRIPLAPGGAGRPPLLRRVRLVASGVAAAFLGLLPHILHHAGPLAGAALFAGVGGSLLFGAIGLIAAIPFLLRMKRHCGSWHRPLATLVLFAAVFLLSTFVVGPALTGDDSDGAGPSATPAERPAGGTGTHEQHH